MIAYMPMTRTICPMCHCDPCTYGTGCVGQRGPTISQQRQQGATIVIDMSRIVETALKCVEGQARLSKEMDEHFRHPKNRYKETPRSPKRRFRKGSLR